MNAEDFYDTTKDAGEVGAGHSVTALYEVELAGTGDTYRGVQLEFSSEHTDKPAENNGRSELCKLSVTYKPVNGNTGKDIYESQLFGMEKYNSEPSESIRLASAAAEFAMLLRNSEFKGSSSYEHVVKTAGSIPTTDKTDELIQLAKQADRLYG